jgi:PiT family inorganic phosphate transporter
MNVIVLVAIITALVFDFTNGFHDTANTTATSIATGALSQGLRALSRLCSTWD